jgi:hypothetical protein
MNYCVSNVACGMNFSGVGAIARISMQLRPPLSLFDRHFQNASVRILPRMWGAEIHRYTPNATVRWKVIRHARRQKPYSGAISRRTTLETHRR